MLKGRLLCARPLDDATVQRIEQRFSSILGDDVQLEQLMDASLLGGIRVEVDGRVYDGSLRLQLSEVLEHLQARKED